MPKFFIEQECKPGDTISIIRDAHHIVHVLRYQAGEKMTLSDGNGYDYLAQITELSENEVQCCILQKTASEAEPEHQIVLFQGLPKAEKMELIIQKNTELGVSEIVPVQMKRSVVKLDEKKKDRKEERWQAIAEAAAKQSGRGRIPKVSSAVGFSEMLNRFADFDLVLLLFEHEHSASLKRCLTEHPDAKSIAVLIGPEGGFEDAEVEACIANGAHCLTLGPRILRTETAGFAALTSILYHYNEME